MTPIEAKHLDIIQRFAALLRLDERSAFFVLQETKPGHLCGEKLIAQEEGEPLRSYIQRIHEINAMRAALYEVQCYALGFIEKEKKDEL